MSAAVPRPAIAAPAIAQPSTMTEAEWHELGVRLFGPELIKWRFKCPSCKLVMSIAKLRAELSDDVRKRLRGKFQIETECIGRYVLDRGCDWAAYGLFSGPFFVTRPSGERSPCFGFDTGASS